MGRGASTISPYSSCQQLTFTTKITRPAVTRIAVDLKLFETLVADDGRPKTLDDLAAPTNASPELVRRIARALIVMQWLGQQGPDHYVPNKMTYMLVQPGNIDGIIFCFESHMPSISRMPEYIRNTGFRNPEGSLTSPFQHGHQTEHRIFDWMAKERTEVFRAFHNYIYAIRAHRPHWLDLYPAAERLGACPDSIFVDVGGSRGIDLEKFRVGVPEFEGRLVLQEVPQAIEAARAAGLHPRLELQAHDFFTPQPVKGARAYFLRAVLHDWPDDACRKILSHLRDAMAPGFSKLLISDCVIADENPAWQHAALDISMMSLVSALERTERDWRALVESCGLKIEHIYSKGVGNESLIEVVRV